MAANRTSEHTLTEPKRGRGRPRLPNALTPAQRAKRYRDNKRASQATGDAGIRQENRATASDTTVVSTDLTAENARLHQALDAAHTRINDLTGALEFFVHARAKNKRITADQMKGLHALLALGNPLLDGLRSNKRRR